MRIAIAYGLRISILLYTLAHIIYSFSEHPQLLQVLSISGIAMIIFALLSIPISDLKLPIFILIDRKSTRLNSSHVAISYAVFCLKKKIIINAICCTFIY